MGVDFSGQTAPFGVFGNGADGDLSVTVANTVVNNYTYVINTSLPIGSTVIEINDTAEFTAGDEILIIQMQNGSGGAKAGTYEFKRINSISSNNIILNHMQWGLLSSRGKAAFAGFLCKPHMLVLCAIL